MAGGFTPTAVIQAEHSEWVLPVSGPAPRLAPSSPVSPARGGADSELHVLLGLVAAPFMPAMFRQIGRAGQPVALGGLAHGVGALATRKTPNPYPGTFGYHEVFHLCVIVGAAVTMRAPGSSAAKSALCRLRLHQLALVATSSPPTMKITCSARR